MTLSRRSVVAGTAAVLATALQRAMAATPRSTATDSLKRLPFLPGDVVVGCTLLNDPNDDHKGLGRILHYDGELRLRQTLWLTDTTHIVQGLHFSPTGDLWAFDAFAHKILWLTPDGHPRPSPEFPPRSFAHVNFLADGRYLLGENFVGDRSRVPLKTTLPFVPGTQRFGEGHLYEFSAEHRLLQIHPTPVHGGMGGFQGLTSSVLVDDDRVLIYTSETGPRVMRWDLKQRRALPDLVPGADGGGRMFFEVRRDPEGRLLVLTGLGIERYDLQGRLLDTLPLGSFGWASMSQPRGAHVYLSNFFSGELARLDLRSGQITARADTGIRKSASGLDEFSPIRSDRNST